MTQFIRKASALALAVFMSTGLLYSAQAAEEERATITINIQDQDGDAFTGRWFLHNGTSDEGTIARNGANGETMKIDAGTYTLRTQAVPGTKSRTVTPEKTQSVAPGESITYTVTYQETVYTQSDDPNTYDKSEVEIRELAKERSSTEGAPYNPQTVYTDKGEVNATDSAASNDAPESSGSAISNAINNTINNSDANEASEPFRLAQSGAPIALPALIASALGFLATRRKED